MSGVAGISCKQTETTHEVFWSTRYCDAAPQKKNAVTLNVSYLTRGPRTIPPLQKRMGFTKLLLISAGIGCTRKLVVREVVRTCTLSSHDMHLHAIFPPTKSRKKQIDFHLVNRFLLQFVFEFAAMLLKLEATNCWSGAPQGICCTFVIFVFVFVIGWISIVSTYRCDRWKKTVCSLVLPVIERIAGEIGADTLVCLMYHQRTRTDQNEA